MNYKFFTPKLIANLMVQLIEVKNPKEIIDLSAGDGSLLIAAKMKWEKAKYVGVDINWNREVKRDLKNNLSINCIESDALALNSIFYNHKHKKQKKFDVVLANPPFDAKRKLLLPEKLTNLIDKSKYELPNKFYIEEIFTLLNLAILNEDGYMGMILPASIISNYSGKWLRKYMLDKMKIKCVIELPRNIFKEVDAVTYLIIGQKYTTGDDNKVLMGVLNSSYKIEWKVSVNQTLLQNRLDPTYHSCVVKYKENQFYKCSKLKDLLETKVKRGFALYGAKKCLVEYSISAVPFWHTTNIKNNLLVPEPGCYIVPNSPAFKRHALTQKGDILMARVGRGCVGKSSLVWSKNDIGIASDCVYILRPLSLEISILIFSFLQCSSVINLIKALSKGCGSLVLSSRDLEDITIPSVSELTHLVNIDLGLSDAIPWKIIKELSYIFERFISGNNEYQLEENIV